MSRFGWNDPPTYSFSSLQAGGKRTTHLTERSHHHQQQKDVPTPTPPPTIPPLSVPDAPPLQLKENHISSLKPTEQEEEDSTCIYDKEDFNDVIKKLESLVDDNQDRFQKRVYDDIKRRINLLSKQFQDGKLSAPVQLKSGQLVAAIDKGDYDGADTIHVQLMVDHVSQVSQWLVGIKKLISLLRSES